MPPPLAPQNGPAKLFVTGVGTEQVEQALNSRRQLMEVRFDWWTFRRVWDKHRLTPSREEGGNPAVWKIRWKCPVRLIHSDGSDGTAHSWSRL